MRRIMDRQGKVAAREDGLSLVEVLVAMMIFAMLVVGIGYSLINVLQMSRDSQAREAAVSLASSELDVVRAIGDPFKVFNDPATGALPHTQTVGGNTFTIVRTAEWTDPAGDVDTCGTGGGPLKYKTVSVAVTWTGMRGDTKSVTSDTALMPTSRINDPEMGTILVSVKSESGLGAGGMVFTAKSATTTLDVTPTNTDGCSFVLKVPPGDYTVTLTNSNYIDIGQYTVPAVTKTVVAGEASKFPFQYDKRGTYLMNYASNDLDPVRPIIPNNLTTTFFNTNGRFILQVPAPALQGTAYLYPAQAGYQVVAGSYVAVSQSSISCTSVDPAAWADDTSKTPTAIGTRAPTAFATPGGTASVTPVPMGILNVTGNNTRKYLSAVSQNVTALPGQPVCNTTPATTYTFGSTFSSATNTTQKIALPFGTWKLYVSNSVGSLGNAVPSTQIALLTPGQPVGTDGTFVLDPRGVTP